MKPPRPGDVALAGLALAALAGAIGAAAAGSGWGTAVALAVAAAAEVGARRRGSTIDWALTATGATPVAAAAARLLAVVALAGRIGTRPVLVASAVTAAVVVGLRLAAQAAEFSVGHLRRPPLLSRNLELGAAALPAAPPTIWTGSTGPTVAAETAVAVGLALAHGRYDGWLEAGFGVAVALAAVPAAVLGTHALRLLRRHSRARVVAAVEAAVGALRPEVVLYFAGSPEEVYQPDMWLQPVERLARPALVLVRDLEAFERLAPTSLPVVCATYNGTLARLPLPPRVVTLFVTHSGNNVAMLRRRECASAFVGHGDSDKPDSVNPYARVYDEVWVAGPLGRSRYAAADVGVRAEAIVEIGRPQLARLAEAAVVAGPPPVPTVLYAPTWEGWGDDPHHSSLGHVGPELVRRLLAEPGLRVRYRPHPLTGRRDPRLRRAHREILRLLGGARAAEAPTALGDALAEASLLIADVSSIVTEFLAVDRPYAVVDSRGLGAPEFAKRFPSVAGGLVLDRDLTTLPDVVAVARGGADPSVAARARLRREAVGDPTGAPELLDKAVERLLIGRNAT